MQRLCEGCAYCALITSVKELCTYISLNQIYTSDSIHWQTKVCSLLF